MSTVAASSIPFGTLVGAGLPSDPVAAVAAELRERGVSVPADFELASRETHVATPEGAEVPLPAHVSAALESELEVRL